MHAGIVKSALLVHLIPTRVQSDSWNLDNGFDF